MAQGKGFFTTPSNAFLAAWPTPCWPAPSKRDSAMQRDVVMTMSMTMVTMAGPAAAVPSKATNKGTPIKPVLGKAPTKAPNAASPVALFTIGAVLARSQKIAHHEQHGPLTWKDYVPVALIKLFLHPVLVLVVGLAAISMGLPIDAFALKVMVLVAALPSASNVAMLSERFGADNGRIARIILVSTAAAFLTFSGVVALLQ